MVSNMVNISASIPDKLKSWIDIQIEKGYYTSTSDYLRDLIRSDQSNKLELEELLINGLENSSLEVDESYWKNKKELLKENF